jgi:hypothetical protein
VGTATAIPCEFGPAFVQGLAELGPFPAPGDDLSLELGLSIWLHQSGAGLEDAHEAMFEVRQLIIEVAGLDPRTEPVPLVGRSVELDLLTLASYTDDLLGRAARSAGWTLEVLAARVIERQGSGEVVSSRRPYGPFRVPGSA